MNFEAETTLLIKSKYPLILVDTIDEGYVAGHLSGIASELTLTPYFWSVTQGLRVGGSKSPFYKTCDPAAMLRTMSDLICDSKPSLFVLSDFHKFLDNAVTGRLFKDIIGRISDTRTTIALVGGEQKLPPDIEPLAARIAGGYPNEKEILAEVNRVLAEFRRSAGELKLALGPQDVRRVVRSLKGMSLQQIRSVINTCVLKDGCFDKNDFLEIEKYKKSLFDREGILEYFGSEQPSAIAGFDRLKKWVRDRKNVFFADKPGLPPPKGVLLLGVQGCGKSLAAKVIAGELGIPLYRLDLNRLYSKYIGETEENLRKALRTVERLSPLCLWIDEIEKILASASSGDTDGGVSKRVLGTMLTWMQERTDRSFISATSNDINNLPPELLRKGRFDEIFFADLPDAVQRAAILKIHLRKRSLQEKEFDVKALAAASEGFSGAELEQAVVSALYSASGANEKICSRHILQEIKQTRPLSVIKAADIGRLRAWAKERSILPV